MTLPRRTVLLGRRPSRGRAALVYIPAPRRWTGSTQASRCIRCGRLRRAALGASPFRGGRRHGFDLHPSRSAACSPRLTYSSFACASRASAFLPRGPSRVCTLRRRPRCLRTRTVTAWPGAEPRHGLAARPGRRDPFHCADGPDGHAPRGPRSYGRRLRAAPCGLPALVLRATRGGRSRPGRCAIGRRIFVLDPGHASEPGPARGGPRPRSPIERGFRRPAPRQGRRRQDPRVGIRSASRASSRDRTLVARASGENGFCRNGTSMWRMPWRTTASSV